MAYTAFRRATLLLLLVAVPLALQGCQSKKQEEETSPEADKAGMDKTEEEEAGLTKVEQDNGIAVADLQLKEQEQLAGTKEKHEPNFLDHKLKIKRSHATSQSLESLEVAGRAKLIASKKNATQGLHAEKSPQTTVTSGSAFTELKIKGENKMVSVARMKQAMRAVAATDEERMQMFSEGEAQLRELHQGLKDFQKKSDALTASMAQFKQGNQPDMDKQAEDAKFDQLEKQTANIMQWFKELKELRKQRDDLKEQKDRATAVFQGLGGQLPEPEKTAEEQQGQKETDEQKQ